MAWFRYAMIALALLIALVPALRKGFLLVGRILWYAFFIKAEALVVRGARALGPSAPARWLRRRLMLPFPRDQQEVWEEPDLFFALLRDRARGTGIPRGARLVRLEALRALTEEPDKNATACGVRVVYALPEGGPGGGVTLSGAGRERSLPVFMKFQTGRGLPLGIQAIRAAMEPGINREVDFYNRLATPSRSGGAHLPQRVPRAMFAACHHRYNRVCIVLEHMFQTDAPDIAGRAYTLADHGGCPEPECEAMMRTAARMHAKYWRRAQDATPSRWIPARKGLEFASFVPGFIADKNKEPDWFRDLWQALDAYVTRKDRPLTLVHGDCRPGNMLFLKPNGGGGEGGEGGDEGDGDVGSFGLPGVVMMDWEAVNVGPFLWDLTYMSVLGQPLAQRRDNQMRLLDAYRASLRAALARACDGDGLAAYTTEEEYERDTAPDACRADLAVLTVVLYYVAWVVRTRKLWDGQGNTADDLWAWEERVCGAVGDLDAGALAAALECDEALVARVQKRAAEEGLGDRADGVTWREEKAQRDAAAAAEAAAKKDK